MTKDIKSEKRSSVVRPPSSEMLVPLGWLRVCACVLMVSHFGRRAICSESDIDTSRQAVRVAADVPVDLPAGQSRRQWWKERAGALDRRRDNSKKDEISRLIEQIRSIQFESSYSDVAQPQRPAQQQAEAEPPAAPVIAVPAVEPEIQRETPLESMDTGAFQMVEDLLKDANTIASPFELAEVLFRSGRLGPAGIYYKQALASIADAAAVNSDRAWILFQIGNCCMLDDPNKARESYAELIRTHPDSPWAEVAKARYGLVDWYQQDQPRKLIQELNR